LYICRVQSTRFPFFPRVLVVWNWSRFKKGNSGKTAYRFGTGDHQISTVTASYHKSQVKKWSVINPQLYSDIYTLMVAAQNWILLSSLLLKLCCVYIFVNLLQTKHWFICIHFDLEYLFLKLLRLWIHVVNNKFISILALIQNLRRTDICVLFFYFCFSFLFLYLFATPHPPTHNRIIVFNLNSICFSFHLIDMSLYLSQLLFFVTFKENNYSLSSFQWTSLHIANCKTSLSSSLNSIIYCRKYTYNAIVEVSQKTCINRSVFFRYKKRIVYFSKVGLSDSDPCGLFLFLLFFFIFFICCLENNVLQLYIPHRYYFWEFF
jgi:hypothetical protein